MFKKLSPEKRVGNTANLLIFLGILYSSLSILAFTGCGFFSGRGYGVISLLIGLSVIGIGYAIRYGVAMCLYVATGIFTCLTIYFVFEFIYSWKFYWALRLALTVWVLSSLVRAIPAMIKLDAIGSRPDRNSKYKDFFLRRKRNKDDDESNEDEESENNDQDNKNTNDEK